VAELGEVRRAVGAALEAHGRWDPEATALATNAYLRFEPLEKLLAESDVSRIDPLEAGFMAFWTALANPSTGDPDRLGHHLDKALDDAASLLAPRTGGSSAPGRLAVALLGALALLAVGLALRSYGRRPVNPAGPSRIS